MNKIPIGLVIKDLVAQKRLSITDLSDKLGISRPNVYNVFQRENLKNSDLERWADALNVSVDYLLTKQNVNISDTVSKENQTETLLNRIQKMFEDELAQKNAQIRELQRALQEEQKVVRELLGKSAEYSFAS